MPAASWCNYTLLKHSSLTCPGFLWPVKISCFNFQQMFYIKQSGNKIPHHNIPAGKKSSSGDWVSPVYSITKKYLTLCIFSICPCCASYPGCDSIINREASCHSTSGGTQTMSIVFADVLSSWAFPGKKGHYAQEAILEFPSTVQADWLWEGEREYYSHFHKWKLIWCHAEWVALGHNREHGPPLGSSCFPAWCSAQVLLFTAFCQCPEDGKCNN